MSNAREIAQLGSVPSGRKNMLLNGDMRIAQRGTSVTGQTSAQYHTVDRFLTETSGGTYDAEQSTTAPDGFSNSLKVTIDGAFTPTSGQYIIPFEYRIEGQDLQRLSYGTSNAKSMTLSFWIRSSKTGTYVVEFSNANSTQARKYSKQYTINSADTWEYKTITWEGDTASAFENNNDSELTLYWWMTAGTNFTSGTIPSGWENPVNANRAVGVATSLADNEEFYLTGVQLEVGSVATEFEHRSYGEELALCERYYQLSGGTGTANSATNGASLYCFFKTPMRATPTATINNGTFSFAQFGRAQANITSISATFMAKSYSIGVVIVTSDTGLTTGTFSATFGDAFAFNAEL